MKFITKILIGLLFSASLQAGWQEAGSALEASDGDSGNYFGFSVDVDRHYAIVGSPSDGDGSAYIFKKDSTGTWIEHQKLDNPSAPSGEGTKLIKSFGFSVAIAESSGSLNSNPSLLVIGAPGSTITLDSNTKHTGAICTYELNTDTGLWAQQDDCLMGVSQAGGFGYSVGISNWLSSTTSDFGMITLIPKANIVASDPFFDAKYEDQGFVMFQDYNATSHSWKIVNATVDQEGSGGGASGVLLGYSVALYRNTAVISAPGLTRPDPNDDPDDDVVSVIEKMGRVYFYTAMGDFISGYTPPHEETVGGHNFGFSVDIFGDYCAVGELHKEGNLTDGAVYVLKNNEGWGPTMGGILTSSAKGYGRSVAINNKHLAVGAPFTGSYNGTVFMYAKNKNDWWDEVDRFEVTKQWIFGFNVALYNDTLMAGAPLKEKVKVFDYKPDVNLAALTSIIMYLLD